MTPSALFIICAISTISCGLISGFFLTFSDFVMRALKLSKPSAGIEVMQIINVEVGRSIFIFLLWGFVVITAAVGIYAYFAISGPAQPYILTGAASYIIGVLGLSYLFNIPMNNKLKHMDCNAEQTAAYWLNVYVPRWTFWNSLRALTSGITAICFLIASIHLA